MKIKALFSGLVAILLAGCSGFSTTATEVESLATVGGCPDGVTVAASGNVYITDICTGEVKKVNSDGTTTVIVDSGDINNPDGITAVTTPEGKEQLYVTQTGTDSSTGEIISTDGSIKKIDVETGVVTELVDNSVITNPTGIAADSLGNLYVADLSGAVYKVTVDGSGVAGTPVDLTQNLPAGVTVEAPHGLTIVENADNNSVAVYVTDQGETQNNIKKLDVDVSANVVVTEVVPPATASSEEGKFNTPHGIFLDSKGAIFVADENNNRVAIITPNGKVVTFAGASDATAGDAVGSSSTSKLDKPRGIAVDSTDSVLVCDYANGKVKKVKQ